MPDWLHIMVRAMASLVFLFVITKIIGKRQLSQMTFFEYTVGIGIGEIAGFMATDLNGSISHTILALSVYCVFPVLIGWLSMKSKKVRDIVEGKASVLIKNGKILEDNLKKERMTTDELLEHLRLKNAFQVADVEFALMEPNGKVSVLLKSQNQPLTPQSFGLPIAPTTEPQTVIMDGTIMDESLSTRGMNRNWLHSELEKAGVTVENVFLGQIDSFGELHLDLYDDKIQVPQPQNRQLAYITLKKCQADLELFALATANVNVKRRYEQDAKRLQSVIDDLTPLLTR